jgi:hypothetical protein
MDDVSPTTLYQDCLRAVLSYAMPTQFTKLRCESMTATVDVKQRKRKTFNTVTRSCQLPVIPAKVNTSHLHAKQQPLCHLAVLLVVPPCCSVRTLAWPIELRQFAVVY